MTKSHGNYRKEVHRPCSSCISSVGNLMGILSSFSCQLRLGVDLSRHSLRPYRNREQEKKGRSTLQNRFEVLASRVMRCGLRGEVKVRRQEVVKKVQCFRCRGTRHCKWECPNIAVEKKKRR